jgi:hypothetical protein
MGVMLMLALFTIAMAIAVPRISKEIQRDREVETMHRGKQYVRAIQLYYRKFNAYPPNIDALAKSNEIRFLRKRYIDPTTGKDDWKLIMFGQNKTPMAMGFFGQPLGMPGAQGAGIGTSAASLAGGSAASFGGQTSSGASGGFGSSTIGSSSLGSSSIGSSLGSSTGSLGGSSVGSSGSGITGSTDTSGSSSTTSGSTTAGTGTTTTGTDANGNPTTGTAGPGATTGGQQTFGGAGIIGVSPASPKESILVYKKKNHYNDWEFLYSILSDQQTISGGNAGTIGQPAGGTGTNGTGTSGFGGSSGFGGTGTSGAGSSGTSTTTPTTPTTPQQ